jgi:hypothetical protein
VARLLLCARHALASSLPVEPLPSFDGDTGAILAQSTTTMSDVEHWNSPIVVNGRLYFAGDKRDRANGASACFP